VSVHTASRDLAQKLKKSQAGAEASRAGEPSKRTETTKCKTGYEGLNYLVVVV